MLLQALNEFYERATKPDTDGETLIEEAAFNRKYIRWIIPLKPDGTLEGGGLIENPEIKKGGVSFSLPKTNRPKVAGGVAEFLWEGLEAIFNLKTEPESIEPNERKRLSQDANRQAKFDDFWRQIEEAAGKSPLLEIVLKFRENYISAENISFLRRGSLKEGEKPAWLVKTASGAEEKLKADSFTFQVDGDFLFEDAAIRAFWRTRFADERSSSEADSEIGLCLVTGKPETAISASHLPKISGVPGTLAIGASLISFEKSSPAFSSYGYEKSYNAPVSFSAVEAYTNSLNYLLSHQKHNVKVGNTKLLFWANDSEDATDFFAELIEKPDFFAVKQFLENAKKGIYSFKLESDSRVYSIILGGNAGRIVVRDWLQIPLEKFADNVASWFEDLAIVNYRSHEKDKLSPFHHYRLAAATVREVKDVKDEVGTQILKGLFHGHTPSQTIIGNLVKRIYADLTTDGKSSLGNLSRFALLRLVVNRNLRKENLSMQVEPTLEESLVKPDLVVDYPYQCGRLLAVFEELQAAYHEYKLEGPSVVEKYYGTASASPNSAFGILWRLHQHHLRKVGRTNGDKGKAKAFAIKSKIAGITKYFKRRNEIDVTSPPEFPRSFNLQEQGRFALGFYQQMAADKEAREAFMKNKKSEENIEGEQSL